MSREKFFKDFKNAIEYHTYIRENKFKSDTKWREIATTFLGNGAVRMFYVMIG